MPGADLFSVLLLDRIFLSGPICYVIGLEDINSIIRPAPQTKICFIDGWWIYDKIIHARHLLFNKEFAMGLIERKETKKMDVAGMFSMLSSVLKPDTNPRTTAPLPNVSNTGSSGDFFIRMSLDLLVASKDYKRNEPLRSAIATALDALDHPETSTPLHIFKPFQIACHSGNPEIITISIDCLGKLFTYNYWKFAADVHVENQPKGGDEDGDNDGTSEMITFVIDTICDTFAGESTDEKVQLQIIKVTDVYID